MHMHLLKVSVSAAAMHLLEEEQDLPSFSASSLSCTVHENNNKKNQQIKQRIVSNGSTFRLVTHSTN